MNINDIETGENKVASLQDIFEHQHELFLKYKEIEGMSWEGDTVNIHTLKGQAWLKDFLWRVTEEVGESYESYEDNNDDHTIEELADALHFFVELCILAGIGSDELPTIEKVYANFSAEPPQVALHYWNAIYKMTMVANTLKNKSWKKHQMKTDKNKFKGLVLESYTALLGCFFVHGATPHTVYDYYFRKSQVNKFRQRSNY